MLRLVGVRPDGDDLPAQFTVPLYDIGMRIAETEPVLKPSGVQFDPFSHINDFSKDLVYLIRKPLIRIVSSLFSPIADHIINMPQHIKVFHSFQVSQSLPERLRVCFLICPAFKERSVVRIQPVYEMDRTDDEIKRILFCQLPVKSSQVGLQPDLDPGADRDPAAVLFFQPGKSAAVFLRVEYKGNPLDIRHPRIVLIIVVRKADFPEPFLYRALNHTPYGCLAV